MSSNTSSKAIKEIYDSDQYQEQYHKNPGERINRIVETIEFTKNDIVVDYGCGNGLLMEVISNKIGQYYGVDYSEKFISICNEKKKKLNIQNAYFSTDDIVKFAFKHKKSFDKAFSLDFSEHLNDKEFLKIFTAIKNSLKKNGTLYMHTPNADFILEILKKKGVLKQINGHIGIRNGYEYQNLLKSCGYSQITVKYLPHYKKSISYLHLLSFLPLIGKFFKARLLIICS